MANFVWEPKVNKLEETMRAWQLAAPTKTLQERIQEERARFAPVSPIGETSQFAETPQPSFRVAQPEPQEVAVKKQALTTLTELPEKPAWYELPKAWAEQATEKLGEGISNVPILPDILKGIAPAFSWIHENLEKPFAAIITSPFSPDLQWKRNESWLDHQKREYDAWDAPSYIKGSAEFAMPLWWMPWFSWAKAGAKAIGVGQKAAVAIAKTGKLATVAEKGLPTSELLDNVLFNAGRLRAASGNIPIVNRIVRMVGGEGAFITKKEAQRISGLSKSGVPLSSVDALTKTKMELVKLGFVSDMRNGVKSLLVPKLQVLGKEAQILGMDAKGVVANIVDKSGKSQYMYDVLEGALKNPDGYNFLTKEAKKFVDELGDILDDVYKLAKNEGVKAPKGLFIHRIVKGKTSPTTGAYEASEYGSLFEKARSHKLQAGGVEAGVDYGLDVAESISSTIDHYVTAIARKRFEKSVGKLGKKPIDMWNALPESTELNLLRASKVEGILHSAERLDELTLMKTDFLRRFKGNRQILGENIARFNRHPVFKNALFPKDVVKTSEKLLLDDSQKWLSSTASASGLSRMLTAAMDLSAPFIQGAAVWGRNPVAWGKGVKNMLEYAWQPTSYYKYLVDPTVHAVRMERILAGGSSSTFEFFKALAPLQRQAARIPGIGRGIQKGIGESWGRAETAFTGFGEVARNEMWKALRRPGMTDDVLMDLSRTIDRMTGVMSTEALAIGRTQQDFENAFVFFAPRYTRAGLAFVGDALKGGMTGAEARKALASLTASGVAFYYGATKALGQQPNFDPSSGRFMTIQIGDSHVGVGGIMTAMARLAYDIGVTAVEDPSNLLIPIRDGKLNRKDNPFVKFMYSRTAPVTSLLMGTVVEQSNYFGEPFESVKDWGEFLANKITPIASQQIVEFGLNKLAGEEQRPFDYPAVAFEFGGLRRFPKASWELMDEERDRISIRDNGKPYDDLNDLEQTRVDKEDTIRKLQSEIDTLTVARGDETDVGFINRSRERDLARKVYEGAVSNLSDAYSAGAIDGIKFREEVANAGYGLGVTYKHIDSQPEYKEVLEALQKPRKIKDKHLEDIAFSEYMDRQYRKDDRGMTEFEDQYGIFQFDKYNAFIEEFRAKYGDEIYQYVLDKKEERDANLPPLFKELQQAKTVMRPYWAVQSLVEQMFSKQFAESALGQRVIQRRRKMLRMQYPEIEQAYQQFYSRQ